MRMHVAETWNETGDIKVMVFRHPLRDALPEWTPGAHVDLRLADGKIRQYSLCGDPADRTRYRIAVKREPGGRGGSTLIHDAFARGSEVHVSAPRNNFPLSTDAARHILVAGGIGITPFVAMTRHLAQDQQDFELHYCSRPFPAPLTQELSAVCGDRLHLYSPNAPHPNRIDLSELFARVQDGTHIYCCGSQKLMDGVRAATSHWPQSQIHFEAFQATLDENFSSEPFDIRIASTGQVLTVPNDKSALYVLREAGFALPSSCELGVCGSCECGYQDGIVLHRDQVLRNEARQDRMMLCVSRARVNVTLDL